MLFKIFSSLIALILGFLGINNSPISSERPLSTATPAPSAISEAPEEPAPSIKTTVPADAHPATAAEMEKFVSTDWRSTVNPRATINFVQYKDAPVPDEFKNKPNVRIFDAGASCNHGGAAVWFEGNVMYNPGVGYRTLIGCPDFMDREDDEVQTYLQGKPTIYFNAVGSRVYLKLPNGNASEWKPKN